jgi:hypothetical protein
MNRDYSKYIGEENKNKHGTVMKIIEFKNTNNITIQFQDEHKHTKQTTYSNFKKGVIKNPYDKTIYGVAYTGEGIHKLSLGTNKNTIEYKTWHNMLGRCFIPKRQRGAYEGCIVCDEWLNFQNYAQWYKDNYYEVRNERMEIDKDILHKGNKIYSPEICVFIPQRINLLLINRKNYRGKTLLGTSRKDSGTFSANAVGSDEKSCYLGTFPTEIEAFNAYKEFRENVFVEVAEEYKNEIPDSVYQALIHRKIDITD